MVTNNILNGRRLKNSGDGNIMRGAGARDGYAERAGAEMMKGMMGVPYGIRGGNDGDVAGGRRGNEDGW